ncbi:hypothetical protein, partial [Chromobacterium sp. ASV23]|uniref:hypothetical protein n=1 Tax=Chromobacterium sp. ASV23 TaxID=2795110 RepID=UPI001E5A960D
MFKPFSLLDWLPGETLFSLVSRLHFFWGTNSISKTSHILFDSPHACCLHDFPDRLSCFALKTNGLLGDDYELGGEHTLLRFYRTFMSEKEYLFALGELSSTRGGALKYKL